ncbi:MAG: hypothetical protein ACXIUL_09450 [Wenzhouxiangella sp.]
MNRHLWIRSGLLALVLSLAPCLAHADRQAFVAEQVARHWQPDTQVNAQQQTLAVAAWLDAGAPDAPDADGWSEQLALRLAQVQRQAARVPPAQAALSDGIFAWLVHGREHNLSVLPPPSGFASLDGVSSLLGNDNDAARLARRYPLASRQAAEIWSALLDTLSEAGVEQPEQAISALLDEWQASADGADTRDAPEPDDGPSEAPWQAYRQAQQARVMALDATANEADQARLIGEILLEQARFEWQSERPLAASWLLLEGLARLASQAEPAAQASEFLELIDQVAESPQWLQTVDRELPAVFALLEDAAAFLAQLEGASSAALSELADAYARLALFAPDAGFYLDQPVRDDIRDAMAQCYPDPLLIGPLPRDLFERCLVRLTGLMTEALDREELTGGGSGPFAAEFLRRESASVAWQRANYLDGHLAWRLDADCPSPNWINTLEWSLLSQHLGRWAAQRPAFLTSERWQDWLANAMEPGLDSEPGRQQWQSCLLGSGGQRLDLVERILLELGRAYRHLAESVSEAEAQFLAENTRAAADLDLTQGPSQPTTYRPEALMVVPCADRETCGARAPLSVSRALLSLFPSQYLLADQLGLGDVTLCYGEVAWVEREQRPARKGDPRVANYYGRLQFELFGEFVQDDATETVFAYRLTSQTLQHYLFAATADEVLETACPREWIGQPVASQLPEDRPGLVPNRLTYFVAAPTTPEAELLANWERGAEWRDWFITGSQLETLITPDPEQWLDEVAGSLQTLAQRRERQIIARLLIQASSNGSEDPLAAAMQSVSEWLTLLRATVELHYPGVARHDPLVRAALRGDEGLVHRDRLRQLRDQQVPMRQMALQGQEQVSTLLDYWRSLPSVLRERGQPSPELDFGLEQLEALRN